jgi:flagellar hook protein FlgE
MFSAFSTAISALNANSTALSVAGDNLANLNTTGFKASRTTFGDLVSQFATEGLEVGAGVGKPTTQRQFVQGSIESTGNALDASLQGSGFFVVRDATNFTLFRRAGNFVVDSTGRLLTTSGESVQGWMAENGVLNPSGPVQDIVLPGSGLLPPVPTTEVAMRLNLDAGAAVGANFSVPAQVVDSLGATHTLTFSFTKSSATDWDYEVTIPGEDLTAGTPGTPTVLTSGSVSFGPDGLLATPTPPGTVALNVTGFANAAADATVNWEVFDSESLSMLTHYAQPSAVSSVAGDGTSAATLISVQIVDGGLLMARFTNGLERPLAQLAIAAIANPESMISEGNNNFRLTSSSASAAIGAAGTGGRGEVRGSALESSTADIAQEFTNLIRFQRAYQANSRVVSTVDEVTQETLNLKR